MMFSHKTGHLIDLYAFAKLAILCLTGSSSHELTRAIREHDTLEDKLPGLHDSNSDSLSSHGVGPKWREVLKCVDLAASKSFEKRQKKASYLSIMLALQDALSSKEALPTCFLPTASALPATPKRPAPAAAPVAAAPAAPQPKRRKPAAPDKFYVQ